MRKIPLAVLAALSFAAAPAAAAPDIAPESDLIAQETGAFAGARLRLPLAGGAEARALRAGLVMAPTLRRRAADGGASTHFGEGLELGLAGRSPPTLSIAGQPLAGSLPEDGPGRRAGVSTLGWVAIGTAVVLAAGTLWFVDAMNESSE